ncbi:Thioredoxin, mitochondrial [Frankliniella fusca]|uniref:Thioredoxin, mitochondrial n=1 Tax=Frankliniella fusca TaxID=407009 RepID=A0AAE1H743_9NEOP|nr:Thioredoxin, mitochondrial [Frankliniella fusca]
MALRNASVCLRNMRMVPSLKDASANPRLILRPVSSHSFVREISSSHVIGNAQCTGTFCLLPQRRLKPKPSGLRYISHSSSVCKVMNSNVPVIVNFHADWCDPCKILTPQLREIVEKTEGLDLAIVDVEDNAELVHTFEVKAVPAVLAIKHGRVVDKFIGLQDADQIEGLVAKVAKMAASSTDDQK